MPGQKHAGPIALLFSGILPFTMLFASTSPALAEAPNLPGPTELKGIVDPNAKWETLYQVECFTEGIAQGGDGKIYFTDNMATKDCNSTGVQDGAIFVYDPSTTETQLFRSPSGQANGLAMTPEGDLLLAEGADLGGRRVAKIDMKTGRSHVLAHKFNGRNLNSPNDVTVGPDGLVYFTDPRYSGEEPFEQPIQGVYRIEKDGAVTLVVADSSKPNGLAFSPDGKTLYIGAADDNGSLDYTRHAENQAVNVGLMALLAYPFNADGTVGPRKVLVDYEGVDTMGPDGLNVDEAGNIYVSLYGGKDPAVAVYTPDGKELGRFRTGGLLPTNSLFTSDSKRGNYFYMAAGKFLFRIPVLVKGTPASQR